MQWVSLRGLPTLCSNVNLVYFSHTFWEIFKPFSVSSFVNLIVRTDYDLMQWNSTPPPALPRLGLCCMHPAFMLINKIVIYQENRKSFLERGGRGLGSRDMTWNFLSCTQFTLRLGCSSKHESKVTTLNSL